MTRRLQALATVLVCVLGLNCAAQLRQVGATQRHPCVNACGADPLCVSGVVTDRSGRPRAGFSVGTFPSTAKEEEGSVSDLPFAMTETDSEGRYTLALTEALKTWRVLNPSAPGPFRVVAIEYGFPFELSLPVLETPACVDLVVEPVPAR